MLKVLFFARIREQLGCEAMDFDYPSQGIDLDGLQQRLCDKGGDAWAEVLGQENVIRAVNQAVSEANRALADGDEVAFYPPVTGG